VAIAIFLFYEVLDDTLIQWHWVGVVPVTHNSKEVNELRKYIGDLPLSSNRICLKNTVFTGFFCVLPTKPALFPYFEPRTTHSHKEKHHNP
jgi:hypothetical protein